MSTLNLMKIAVGRRCKQLQKVAISKLSGCCLRVVLISMPNLQKDMEEQRCRQLQGEVIWKSSSYLLGRNTDINFGPAEYCGGIRVSRSASCTRRSRRKQNERVGAREHVQSPIKWVKRVVCLCVPQAHSVLVMWFHHNIHNAYAPCWYTLYMRFEMLHRRRPRPHRRYSWSSFARPHHCIDWSKKKTILYTIGCATANIR